MGNDVSSSTELQTEITNRFKHHRAPYRFSNHHAIPSTSQPVYQSINQSINMGQFSYDCTKCGSHSQFDWIDDCVVKIGDIYVEGTYNAYGQVEVFVLPDTTAASPAESDHDTDTDTDPDTDTDAANTSKSVRTIEVQLEQFRKFFSYWDVDGKVIGTEIYCNGDCDALPNQKPKADFIKQNQMNMAVMLGMADADDYVDRCCVPSRRLLVQPYLLESDLDGLPTVSMVEDDKSDDEQSRLKHKEAR